MTFTIEKGSGLDFTPPDFLCDKCIHTQITPPLPQTAHAMPIAGAPGSEKTSMMVSLLQEKQDYRKCFNHVFVVMPQSSARSLKKNIFEDHDKMYDDLDYDTLDSILEHTRKSTKEKENFLVIIDDFGVALRDKEIRRQLKKLLWNRRHLRTSIWIILQSYISVPLQVRKAVSHLIAYKPRNKVKFHKIFEELAQLPRETADALSRFIFDAKYNYMLLDCSTDQILKEK
jgi:hypothetical protein